MRDGCTDDELSDAMAHLWRNRTDRYSALRSLNTARPAITPGPGAKKIEMSYIGG